MAPPKKRSKRRRAPQAQPVRARPRPAAGKPPAPADKAPRAPNGPEPPPPPPVDAVEDGPPPLLGDPDGPTLGEVDLAIGAPPENLGAPSRTPPEPEEVAALVTGELAPEDDHDAVELVDDDPARTAEALPPRSGRAPSKADQLDAEDELLPAARNVKGRPPAKVGGNRVTAFLRASWAELQRVQWPNRRQVGQATAVVLGFVVIAGGYLGLADLISSTLVDAIL